MWGWGKTQSVPEEAHSGYLDDCSAHQREVLDAVRDWVKAEDLDPESFFNDHDLLRFCRARKFVVEDVQLMFSNFIIWRRQEKIDDIFETFEFPERD
jgi:hypothetical protein